MDKVNKIKSIDYIELKIFESMELIRIIKGNREKYTIKPIKI